MNSSAYEIFVPGRLCILGEHSDWAAELARPAASVQGHAIIIGTEHGLSARASKISDKQLIMTSIDNQNVERGPLQFPFELEALQAIAVAPSFWSYVAGTTIVMLNTHGPFSHGLQLCNYKTTLPISKGLSSSAAVCVLVARAFSRVFNLNLTTEQEMDLAYQGEIATSSQCGRMDQACAFGSVPVLLTFHNHTVSCTKLQPRQAMHFVIVDLNGNKSTVNILSSLQQAYPDSAESRHVALRQFLEHQNESLVSQAAQCIGAGDLKTLGQLMNTFQEEFDRVAQPVCPEELNAPILHKVLTCEGIQGLIWGGKGVGSQGDGTAQFLCKGQDEAGQVCQILERECGVTCIQMVIKAHAKVALT